MLKEYNEREAMLKERYYASPRHNIQAGLLTDFYDDMVKAIGEKKINK